MEDLLADVHRRWSATAWRRNRRRAALVVMLAVLMPYSGKGLRAQSTEMVPRHAVWLNETVVYIIEEGERTAFLALKTAEERDRFIEQFWQRRNPHPEDAAHNAFKDEHYRRVAYANEHFAVPPNAGWHTDRGRIYIIFGPPDEIESHPDHSEMWTYRDRYRFEFRDGKIR